MVNAHSTYATLVPSLNIPNKEIRAYESLENASQQLIAEPYQQPSTGTPLQAYEELYNKVRGSIALKLGGKEAADMVVQSIEMEA